MAKKGAQIHYACDCGAVQFDLLDQPDTQGTHIVCYCDDCQAYAEFLGHADTLLDEHGGSDLYQTSPARLGNLTGAEHLAVVQLTSKGVLRWYCRHCRRPVGNTLGSSAVPFIGLLTRGFTAGSPKGWAGPVESAVFKRHARGNTASLEAYDKLPLKMIFPFLRRVARRRLRGDHKRSPLFDPATLKPIVEAEALDERAFQEIKQRRFSAGND